MNYYEIADLNLFFVTEQIFILAMAITAFLLLFFLTKILSKSFIFALAIAIISATSAAYFAQQKYDYLASKYIEAWLLKKREYQIVFQDFPQDKQRFIAEYLQAFETAGEQAFYDKEEEMKIIMLGNHFHKYLERVSTKVMYKHVVAKARINRALYNVDSNLCKKYADYTGHFQEVRKAVGDEIFLESVKYIPDMIISAVENPDYPKWLFNSQISYEYKKIMYDSYYATEDLLGKKIPENENNFFCLRNALIYEDLRELSPEKAALVWKYWLKKEREDKK